jgi:hypothetical protein
MTSRPLNALSSSAWLVTVMLVLKGVTVLADLPEHSSLGVIAASDRIIINGLAASGGTTVFPGDTIEARDGPALLSFHDGNRVELVKAKATFTREGQRLILQPQTGLLRFNFKEGQDVLILAGRYHLVSGDKKTPSIGGLAINQNGQLAVKLCLGTLLATGNQQSETYRVTPEKSLLILRQVGLGNLHHGEDTLADATKAWQIDELKGQNIRIGDETHVILSNGETSLTIDAVWEKPSECYPYEIKEQSGTSRHPKVAINCSTPEPLDIIVPAAVAAAGVTAGVAVGIHIEEKSASSRY